MCRHARDVVLHISHDAWVEDEKQDIPMRQLSDKEVRILTPWSSPAQHACCFEHVHVAVVGAIPKRLLAKSCTAYWADAGMQVEEFRLRREGCDWWGAEVDVLPYGLVLDFVFSDSALQAWDNNGQQVCFCLH